MRPAGAPAAVLWDFDGTLVDSEGVWDRIQHRLAAELGGVLPEGFHLATTGGTVRHTASMLADACGTDRPVDWIERELWARAKAELARGPVRWMPGVEPIVRELAAAGVPQGVVSSGHRHYLDVTLRRFAPSPFAVEIAGDEVDRPKPDPEPYLRAAAALGVDPAACLVLEDSAPGVAAGLAAGCTVVAVPTVGRVEAVPGVVVAPSLDGLGAAGLFALAAASGAGGRS